MRHNRASNMELVVEGQWDMAEIAQAYPISDIEELRGPARHAVTSFVSREAGVPTHPPMCDEGLVPSHWSESGET